MYASFRVPFALDAATRTKLEAAAGGSGRSSLALFLDTDQRKSEVCVVQ